MSRMVWLLLFVASLVLVNARVIREGESPVVEVTDGATKSDANDEPQSNNLLAYFATLANKMEKTMKMMTLDIKGKTEKLKEKVNEDIAKLSVNMKAKFKEVGSSMIGGMKKMEEIMEKYNITAKVNKVGKEINTSITKLRVDMEAFVLKMGPSIKTGIKTFVKKFRSDFEDKVAQFYDSLLRNFGNFGVRVDEEKED